jgi:hypothetical protein
LSASVAAALFGEADPLGKTLKLNNADAVTVTGVYEDLPQSSSFADMAFVAPWSLYLASSPWIKREDWWQNGFETFVQVASGRDVAEVSAKIRHLKRDAVGEEGAPYHPELFLFPCPAGTCTASSRTASTPAARSRSCGCLGSSVGSCWCWPASTS